MNYSYREQEHDLWQLITGPSHLTAILRAEYGVVSTYVHIIIAWRPRPIPRFTNTDHEVWLLRHCYLKKICVGQVPLITN